VYSRPRLYLHLLTSSKIIFSTRQRARFVVPSFMGRLYTTGATAYHLALPTLECTWAHMLQGGRTVPAGGEAWNQDTMSYSPHLRKLSPDWLEVEGYRVTCAPAWLASRYRFSRPPDKNVLCEVLDLTFGIVTKEAPDGDVCPLGRGGLCMPKFVLLWIEKPTPLFDSWSYPRPYKNNV
jgi:hypothetical protein